MAEKTVLAADDIIITDDGGIDADESEEASEINQFRNNGNIEDNSADHAGRSQQQNIESRRSVQGMDVGKPAAGQQMFPAHAEQQAGSAGLAGNAAGKRCSHDSGCIQGGRQLSSRGARHFKQSGVSIGERSIVRPDQLGYIALDEIHGAAGYTGQHRSPSDIPAGID